MSEVGANFEKNVFLKGIKEMKVLCTYTVNHTINGEKLKGRVVVGLHEMTKDGNKYEYIKTYKLSQKCSDVPTGSDVELLFDERGKVGGFVPNK